jgi:two-component system copper resistance phosphate regulon response regulator CusR
MIVDDIPDIATSLKRGLERFYFSVEAFTDPREALAAFYSDKYDFALLDVNMPNMNGFELCRELMKKDSKLVVCFLTAFQNYRSDYELQYPMLGTDCFLEKPMPVSELAAMIRKLLAKRGSA